MKKILALILTVTLLAAAGAALADTMKVEAGSPTVCAPELFQTYFDLVAGSSGYNFTWDPAPATEGEYSVYTATSSDGKMIVKVYAKNGGVVYAEGTGTIPVDLTNSESLRTFGEWFGASISCMGFSMFIGENGAEAFNDGSAMATFQDDLNSFVTELQGGMNSASEILNGFVITSTILGYPAGLEVKGSLDGGSVTLAMRVVVCSKDGNLTKK